MSISSAKKKTKSKKEKKKKDYLEMMILDALEQSINKALKEALKDLF